MGHGHAWYFPAGLPPEYNCQAFLHHPSYHTLHHPSSHTHTHLPAAGGYYHCLLDRRVDLQDFQQATPRPLTWLRDVWGAIQVPLHPCNPCCLSVGLGWGAEPLVVLCWKVVAALAVVQSSVQAQLQASSSPAICLPLEPGRRAHFCWDVAAWMSLGFEPQSE